MQLPTTPPLQLLWIVATTATTATTILLLLLVAAAAGVEPALGGGADTKRNAIYYELRWARRTTFCLRGGVAGVVVKIERRAIGGGGKYVCIVWLGLVKSQNETLFVPL